MIVTRIGRGGLVSLLSTVLLAPMGCELVSGIPNDNAVQECDDGEFLLYEFGTCGVGVTGVCTSFPEACTEEFSPVCGCDGETYGNDCQAAAAGTSVLRSGECAVEANDNDDSFQVCGGIAGTTCILGDFCQFAVGSCGDGDQTGFCSEIPEVCTTEDSPVCGCDGITYGNACLASSAGVSVAQETECL